MTLSKIKRALRLFKNSMATSEQTRYNAMAYLKALEYLGDKWMLSKANASSKLVPKEKVLH